MITERYVHHSDELCNIIEWYLISVSKVSYEHN